MNYAREVLAYQLPIKQKLKPIELGQTVSSFRVTCDIPCYESVMSKHKSRRRCSTEGGRCDPIMNVFFIIGYPRLNFCVADLHPPVHALDGQTANSMKQYCYMVRTTSAAEARIFMM
eukprot:scaffold257878_cov18-Prasinocladus_malaysianus.AAC.1